MGAILKNSHMNSIDDKIYEYLINKSKQEYWFNDFGPSLNYFAKTGTVACGNVDTYPTALIVQTTNILNNVATFWGAERYVKMAISNLNTRLLRWEAYARLGDSGNQQIFLGMIDTGQELVDYGQPAIDCANFYVEEDVDANWHCRTYHGAEEQTDGLQAIDTAFHLFRIDWTLASVKFYIDNVLKATHSTRIPLEGQNTQGLIKTLETDYKAFHVVYVKALHL